MCIKLASRSVMVIDMKKNGFWLRKRGPASANEATALRQALEAFYRQHRQHLFTFALAVTRCSARAEDAVHDAFCRLLQAAATPLNMKAYVFRCVRNAAVDQLRRHPALDGEPEESILDPGDDPREAAGKSEFDGRAAVALQTLSDDERETIALHLYSDLTFREIADVRETPMGTVTAWYRRGMEKLRRELEEKP